MESKPNLETLADFAAYVGGEVGKDLGVHLDHLTTDYEASDEHAIAFAENDKYVAQAAKVERIGAVIVPMHITEFPHSFIRHEKPRLAFLKLLQYFDQPYASQPGIHPSAVVEDGAKVDQSASIGALAYVSHTAEIGEGAIVMPFAYIGERCFVGEHTVVMPHAVLVRNVHVGDYCEIGPGCVVGHSGFGYQWDGKKQVKVPQVGGVCIGNHVDVGALTAIDRATAGQTLVHEGNKIDNLVQIAHNVELGPHGVYASGVGIAGSTKVGARAMLGGQSGYSDHLVIADGVALAGRAVGFSSISEPGVYGGAPAQPIGEHMRVVAVQKDLPNLLKRIRTLEKEVKALKGEE
jgi:UDP-3-O-[3-hydroxymyristoyl] glucosamine N-acyltransferase